jgi:hypothetical protein
MGVFASTPVIAEKWSDPGLVLGLKTDVLNFLRNLETVYKDIYYSPSWDNDGNPNQHPAFSAATALVKSDICYVTAAGSIAPSLAASFVRSHGVILVNKAVTSGSTVANYTRSGVWSATRYTFTPGSLLYISASTPGLIVAKQPTNATVGNPVGIAETATRINFLPLSFGPRPYPVLFTATWNPPSIATYNAATKTLTVTGARPGDPVIVGFTTGAGAGNNRKIYFRGQSHANDEVTVSAHNPRSGAEINLGAGTIRGVLWKF